MNPQINTDQRPEPEELEAVSGNSLAQCEAILALSDVFVSARDEDDNLIGFTHANGNGVVWTVERLWVANEHRLNGLGMTLRKEMIAQCARRTVGDGIVRGFFSESTEDFWRHKDFPGTAYTGQRVAERAIVGL